MKFLKKFKINKPKEEVPPNYVLSSFNILKDNQSKNNGGSTDYYKLDPSWEHLQDIIEERDLNYSQGNILKVAFCINLGRHEGTNYERELNKLIYFANRELDRIKKEHSNDKH